MKFSSRILTGLLVVFFLFSANTGYSQGWLKKGLEEAKKQKDKAMKEYVKPHMDLAKDAVPKTKFENGTYSDDKYGYTIQVLENWKPYRSGGLFIETLKANRAVPPSDFPEHHTIELFCAEKPFFKDADINLDALKANYEKETKDNKGKVTSAKVMDYQGVKCVYMETKQTLETEDVFKKKVTLPLQARVYMFHLNGVNYQATYTSSVKHWEDLVPVYDSHFRGLKFFAPVVKEEAAEGK